MERDLEASFGCRVGSAVAGRAPGNSNTDFADGNGVLTALKLNALSVMDIEARLVLLALHTVRLEQRNTTCTLSCRSQALRYELEQARRERAALLEQASALEPQLQGALVGLHGASLRKNACRAQRDDLLLVCMGCLHRCICRPAGRASPAAVPDQCTTTAAQHSPQPCWPSQAQLGFKVTRPGTPCVQAAACRCG